MNTYYTDEYLASFCIPSMISNTYNFPDEYGWMKNSLWLTYCRLSIYTMITKTMYFSFNWVCIGSHTNRIVIHIPCPSIHPISFSTLLPMTVIHEYTFHKNFSFSHFLPSRMYPVTFFPSMTKQLSFYRPALFCCTFCLFIGSVPALYAPTNLSPLTHSLRDYACEQSAQLHRKSQSKLQKRLLHYISSQSKPALVEYL
jgi:hypothetical protein